MRLVHNLCTTGNGILIVRPADDKVVVHADTPDEAGMALESLQQLKGPQVPELR
jgi:hypothetical protein